MREDYSPYGTAWDYFPHDHARSRAYRWNEDGIAGISDRHQKICFRNRTLERPRSDFERTSLWFDRQRRKPRRGRQGVLLLPRLNSDALVHEVSVQVSASREFPYGQLVEENRRRGKLASEFELIDTGIFDGDRYFDVVVEYAKADVEDILVKITATNRGLKRAR